MLLMTRRPWTATLDPIGRPCTRWLIYIFKNVTVGHLIWYTNQFSKGTAIIKIWLIISKKKKGWTALLKSTFRFNISFIENILWFPLFSLRSQQTFFGKEPNVSILGLMGHKVSVRATHHCQCSMKAAMVSSNPTGEVAGINSPGLLS